MFGAFGGSYISLDKNGMSNSIVYRLRLGSYMYGREEPTKGGVLNPIFKPVITYLDLGIEKHISGTVQYDLLNDCWICIFGNQHVIKVPHKTLLKAFSKEDCYV